MGIYTLTYNKIDIAGNSAITVNRTVMVTDQTNPTAIVEYSTTGAINQSVIVTLTGVSESISLTNN